MAGNPSHPYVGGVTKLGAAVNDPNRGVVVGTYDAATQAAAITTQDIGTPSLNTPGRYCCSWSAVLTRQATVSSTLGAGFTLTYTDADTGGSVTASGPQTAGNAANAVGATACGTVIAYVAAGSAITFSLGYTSSGATTMQYSVHVTLELIQ